MKKAIVIFDLYTSINIIYECLAQNGFLIGAVAPNNNLDFILKTRINREHFSELLILK